MAMTPASTRQHCSSSQGLGCGGQPHRLSLRHRGVALRQSTLTGATGPNQQAVAIFEDAKTKSFLDWAKAAGITSSKLGIGSIQGIRGLVASQNISPDDILISVPRSSAITLPPKMRCPFPDLVNKEFWDRAPWFVKLALLLLNEKRKGDKSQLATYLRQLPEKFDAPVLWEHSKLQLLQYPYLIHQVKEQQMEWDKLHKDLQAALQPGHSISKQDLFWAMSAVRSRTFSGPYIGSTLRSRVRLAAVVGGLALLNVALGTADLQKTLSAAIAVFIFNILYELILSRSLKQYAMCPFIDFMNHSSSVEDDVSYDYFQDSYSVSASRSYQQGEQVYVSYGKQSNDSLMQYYGFAEADNPSDVYVMTNMLKWLEQEYSPEQSRLDQLNSAGLLKSLQLVSVVRGGFPAETLQALRFLMASDAEAARGVQAFTSPASDAVEARLAQLLLHACEGELRALSTSLSEDQAQLSSRSSSKSLGPEERMAVLFRSEKKKVLMECMRMLGAGSTAETASGSSSSSKQPSVVA